GSRGSAWRDRNELAWTNPYDSRVWEYIIALSEELVDLGFDEIQFDYVRFPSDGNLECISYPLIRAGWSKSQAIVAFLEQANRRLKPKGAVISVDLFGMVAWKREFGIGQVLEEIAPHVDVICPMLYPSHFPAGFLGWAKPENHPRDIMAKSLARMQERTDREIRPWIQGFWYEPFAIQEQFEAVEDSGISGWTVWNPAARYQPTYQALAQMREVALNEPQLYPSLAELEAREPYLVRGNFRIVNYTDYREGFSIVSLDESKPGRRNNFATPAAMLAALDEAIIDHVLTTRNIAFTPWTTKARKQALLAGIMCADTGISPTRMRAVPIYLDWKNSCTFSLSPPPDRIALYKHLSIRPS
ncbi:MAG: putative glycoside hydrolase, partial [Desulfovibrionales bacterium]